MTDSYRQEVFNVLLAQLLQERGVIAAPENVIKSGPAKQRRIPDVIVHFQGLRTAIEGEVEDQPHAQVKAIASARQRIEGGIAHIGVAVVYPAHLRGVDFGQLKSQLAHSELQIAIVTESGDTPFAPGDVDYLESALRRAFRQLVEEDVVAQAVAALDTAIEQFASAIVTKAGVVGRAALALDMREPPLSVEEKGAVSRISGLVLANAMIFHEILAQRDTRITPLQLITAETIPFSGFTETWQFIIDEINYYPIFAIARAVLFSLTANADITTGLKAIAHTAQDIVHMRAALHRDLMGRIYHRLLVDAKYLGTYYTSIPAAALLLKLALRPDAWATAWHAMEQIGQLRMADLSCGTGTLLMAAAETVTDNHISAAAEHEQAIDLDALQRVLAEDVLYGYDVLSSAIHLTASTLALRAPDTTFTKMNLFSLPLGGQFYRLGSIEFLTGRDMQARDLFGAASQSRQVTGTAVNEIDIPPLPDLDLCVMNPPFTRSVGGNLLFGSVPEDERQPMQKKLKRLVQKPHIQANITAGLGSVFVATGDRYVKPDGRLALVLPKALLSGVAWQRTRQLLAGKYTLEYIVASQDPERWNFSDSTDLSEVLLIAKKMANHTTKRANRVVVLNLWRNPTTAPESLVIAHAVTETEPPDVLESHRALDIFIGQEKVGEALSIPWARVQSNWLHPCAFAQSDLIRVTYHLTEGHVWLPGQGQVGRLALCPLGELGTLGPDRRDIHDGFKLSSSPTAYPAFWGHDAGAVLTLAQEPNRYLSPLAQALSGRNLRQAEDLWPRAGTILLAERLRVNTQKLVATRFSKPVLSNVWWPLSLNTDLVADQYQKVLTLWLNSTFSLLILLANRGETEGAWIDFKKPTLGALPVLDIRTLSLDQLAALSAAYDRLADQALLSLPEMNTDDVRAEIDRSIAQALGLPDFSILRTLLAQEPVVCLRRL